MKGFFKRLGALFGGIITFVALVLILVSINKTTTGTISLFSAIPLAFVVCIVCSQFFPGRFTTQALFGVILFLGASADAEVKTDTAKETIADTMGFFLGIIHLFCWGGLCITAFFSDIGGAFWPILMVSSLGVLFPLALSDTK